MTDCPDARHLAAYLERRCDELAAERLERHAAGCDRCFARLEAATRIPGADALPSLIPPQKRRGDSCWTPWRPGAGDGA